MELQTPVNVCDLNPILDLFHLVHTGYSKETTFIKITPRKKDRADAPIRAAVIVVDESRPVDKLGSDAIERNESEKVYATGKDCNDAASNLLETLKRIARNKISAKQDELEREKEKLAAYI